MNDFRTELNQPAYQHLNEVPFQDPNFLPEDPDNSYDAPLLTKDTQVGFIRKVFGIVGSQLILTALMITLSMTSKPLNDYQRSGSSTWTLIVAIILDIVILYVLMCNRRLARKVPGNYIMLGTFTACLAWAVSFLCIKYDPQDVFIAACATAAVVIGLFIYALNVEIDFGWWIGFWIGSLFGMLALGILSIFYYSRWVMLAWSALMVLVFSAYILIDLYMIIGQDGGGFSKDDYIVAALMLYIDIMRLFLEILRLVGSK
jgi:FtsH-binding integral membrane protein